MEVSVTDALLENVACSQVSNGSTWARLGPHFLLTSACPNLTSVEDSRDQDGISCDLFLCDYKPTTGEVLQYLGYGAQIPIILACFVEATLIVLFLVEVCLILKLNSAAQSLNRCTLMVLAAFPMDGLVNLVALLSPKGYDSILLYHFISRCWLLAAFYFLSERLISNAAPQLSQLYQKNTAVTTKSWALVCFMVPARFFTWLLGNAYQRKSEAAVVMRICHLQAFPVLIILLLCSNALETSGLWSKLQVGTNWGPSELFPLLGSLSYLTAFVGHLILLSNFRNFLDHFKYSKKLVCVEWVTLTGVFWMVRALLLKHEVLGCVYPLSSGILSKWAVFASMQFLLLVPATLAWFAFVQPLKDNDKSCRSAIYTVCTTGLGTPPPTPSRIRTDSLDRPLFPRVDLELIE